jgi:hypothetical protein
MVVWVLSQADAEQAVLEYLQENHNVPLKKCIEDVSASKSLDKELVTTAILGLIGKNLVTRKRHIGLNLATAPSTPSELEHKRPTKPEKGSTGKLSEKAKKLLDNIPKEGFVGNVFLRSRLDWSSEEYWEVREELLKAGLIQTGKGRGGSVARTVEGMVREEGVTPKGLVKKEKELYKPLEKWLDENLGRAPKEAGDYFKVKVTAPPSGHKRKSGKWSRPALVSVEVNRFEYLPGCTLDVTTFEVKRYKDAEDLASVFEAAAHTRWANNAYLVIEVPDPEDPIAERITSELARFHIGLLTIYRKNGSFECDEKLEPIRQNPDPKEQDTLLKMFFKDDEKSERQFKAAIGR